MRREPLQLVQIDDEGRCHPQKAALDVLRNLPKGKKIGVIGVAGLYRTGKSFLLNRLMGLQSGFDIGSTVNACTKGIWMWGQPVDLGSDFMVVLLDTEGLGSAQRTTNSDMKIFSLCILLSSLFILNSMGAIDEIAIESLNLVLNLTKNIQVKASDKQEEDLRSLSQHFPAFHWVLRDFSLQPKDEHGNDLSSREYMEHCLTPNSSNEAKNKIRTTIRDLFKQRDCTFLVRPVGDEKTLQNLASIPYESLREPFRKAMDGLTKEIYTSLKPKGMGNSSISGPMLAHLCEEYCEALNNHAIPSIHSAWQAVVQEQLRRVSKQAAAHYRKEMNEGALNRLPMDDEELRNFHKTKKKEAMDIFQASFLEPVNERQLQSVKPYISNLWQHSQKENKDASRSFCTRLANDAIEKAKAQPASEETIMQEYLKHAVGQSSFENFSQMLVPKLISLVRTTYQAQLTALEGKVRKAQSDAQEARSALSLQKDVHESQADDQVRKMRGQIEAREAQWKLETDEMRDEHQSTVNRLMRDSDQLESQKRALVEQVKSLQEKIDKMASGEAKGGTKNPFAARDGSGDPTKDLSGIAESVNEALGRLQSLEIEKAELKNRNEHERQLIGLERKFNQKMTEARRESEAKVEVIRREYEKELEEMREQYKEMQIKVARQDAELKKTSLELETIRSAELSIMKQVQIHTIQRELAEAMLHSFKNKTDKDLESVLARKEGWMANAPSA